MTWVSLTYFPLGHVNLSNTLAVCGLKGKFKTYYTYLVFNNLSISGQVYPSLWRPISVLLDTVLWFLTIQKLDVFSLFIYFMRSYYLTLFKLAVVSLMIFYYEVPTSLFIVLCILRWLWMGFSECGWILCLVTIWGWRLLIK